MSFIDPELPDDPGELVEREFSDDVEIYAVLEGMGDTTGFDVEAFADRTMEVIKLEDLFDKE